MDYKRFDSSEGSVWKYVFDFGDAIAEAVLYRYDDFYKRTVICCSVQSGCPVGCVFCGTGKKFIRNLSAEEILEQIIAILKDMNIEDINGKGERFQIMFMSMGEPFLNILPVINAIVNFHHCYPNAELLISTVGINDNTAWQKFFDISSGNKKIGLQFSLHSGHEGIRNQIIPFKNKITIRQLRDYGIIWNKITDRPVYLNYCVNEDNMSLMEIEKIKNIFSPVNFNLTFSVICSKDETMKSAGYKNYEKLREIQNIFINDGYNVRLFDPAGQDDIGGGCGQLWYVQDWIKRNQGETRR